MNLEKYIDVIERNVIPNMRKALPDVKGYSNRIWPRFFHLKQ